ncbi:nucleotide-binding universal stress UspA family protein [Catenulispora sp. GP43]|uniref:universal stress protein n=1 Tax=Catenulispora sp. GP43 TaxID=3156263 RepID=UPI0035182040
MTAPAPVVVGIDEADQSSHALEFAGREAVLRSVPLWIAHTYHRAPPVALGAPDGRIPVQTVLDMAVDPLAGAVTQMLADHPGTPIRTYVLCGSPAPGLAALARDASLLVLGHSRGGLAGMLLGSVALRTVAHAPCPTAVARGARRQMNRVLAGVDIGDPAGGRAQLGFAFDEAVMRAADLLVLPTWEDQNAFHPDPTGDYTRDRLALLAADHRERLEAVLEPWRRAHPDVAVDVLEADGSGARSLVEASGHADLLVLGAHPHPGGEGMRLGGLAYALLQHARCPVVLVPERAKPWSPLIAAGTTAEGPGRR